MHRLLLQGHWLLSLPLVHLTPLAEGLPLGHNDLLKEFAANQVQEHQISYERPLRRLAHWLLEIWMVC